MHGNRHCTRWGVRRGFRRGGEVGAVWELCKGWEGWRRVGGGLAGLGYGRVRRSCEGWES